MKDGKEDGEHSLVGLGQEDLDILIGSIAVLSLPVCHAAEPCVPVIGC